MAEKTPVRVNYDGSNNPIGFAEFQADDFIGLDDGGTGGSYASLAELLSGVGLGTGDTPTFTGIITSGDVTIGGNLTVDGTTTTVNSTTVTIDDPIFTLGGDAELAADDNKDRGIEFRWHDGTGSKLGFFGFDDSTGKFTFIPDAINAAETFSGTAGTIVANLEGNVTGTISSISNFDTDDLTEGATNLYFTNERVDDRVAALLIDSTTSGIDISYDDVSNSLTISTDLSEIIESLQDNVEGLFVGGTGVSATYNDASNQLELAIDFSEFDTGSITEGSNLFFTDERVDDRISALLVDANTEGIDVSYDDAGNQLTLSVDLTEIVESLQDNVQGLFSGGTGITATYDDAANTLALSIDFTEFDTDDLVEGTTNLFYTEGRFDTSFAGKSTTDLTEGTNLYYTTARANTDFDTKLAAADTDDLSEGSTNLYYTDTRANSAIDTRVDKAFIDALNVDADTLDGIDSTGFATSAQGTLADSALQSGDNITELTNNANYIDLTDISVTDSGGDGSLSYDNTTGVITYTGPSQAEVLAHISGGTGITVSGSGVIATTITQYADSDVEAYLSGGTGVSFSSGVISIGQAVGTTDNVTFNDVTVNGVLNSNDITAANISIDGNATITGDLTVEGTTTQVDSTTVTVADPLFKYAKDNTGNSVDIGFYGKYVQSSTTKYAGLAWDASQSDKFRLFHGLQTEPTTTVDITATGHTVGTLIANLEGDVTGNADTATALASAQNFSLTGDVTATAISFDGTGAVALSTTVTESAVTQHEAALTITESQISDLQSYLTVETNDLTSAVTWANVPDANITQSSVTQHQAALSINESQITFTSNFLENLVEDLTPQLGGTLDANGNTIDMGVNVITDTKVGQWDTAYSWGDHASAGYLTSYTETDPIYTASSWYTTTNNSANWDTAYGWGDHSAAGYLTSFTETNDLTAAVTWANVPDANITETSVTQHEAALSITESQISDLGSYITASSTDTLTNKTFDANGTGNSLSNVETADIASGSKSGSDTTLITGTAGTNGNVVTWNADGDAVDSGYAVSAFVGGVNYQGTWNASTNSPTIPTASSSNKGYYYKVSVAGSTSIDGETDWKVGDWIISNGTTWDKVDNTESVSSVFGRTGAVTASFSDISGTATHEQGGLEADVRAYSGLIKISGGATSAITDNSSDWDTAFGWGDHSLEGYLTNIDAESISSLADVTITSIASGEILKWSGTAWINNTLAEAGILSNVLGDTEPQLGGQLDVNGNAIGDGTRELLTFTEDGSAVNHINIENQATGGGPIIRSTGTDTNVDLNLQTKGSGDINLESLIYSETNKKLFYSDITGVGTGTALTITSAGVDSGNTDGATGGALSLGSGDAGDSAGGNTGNVTLVSGASTTGNSGSVEINSGGSATGSGSITLRTGSVSSSGSAGDIILAPEADVGGGTYGDVRPDGDGVQNLGTASNRWKAFYQTTNYFVETGAGTNYVAFTAPSSIASDVTWTLPNADGSSGQVLSTNGSGTLSWVTASGGGGIALTDLSVGAEASASGDGAISYDNTTGVFTYTPPTAAGISAITASSTDTLTNKTFDANGTGNSLSNVETADIASGSKTGSDTTLVTGTAGTNGNLVSWNADGDAVDSSIVASNVALTDGDTYTGTHDFGGATLEIPNGAAPSLSVAGQIALDTSTTDHTALLKYHDGTNEFVIPAILSSGLSTTDNDVIAYNAANNRFEMEAQSGSGGGTVTSVDMSVPTGFAISGNPITSSGTLALAFDTGYSLPSDATQATWITASSTTTFTNKTFDADGTGNIITNIGSSEIKAEIVTGLSEETNPESGDYLLGVEAGGGALRKFDVGDLPFAPVNFTENAQTGTSYTLVLSDDGKVVTMNNVSSNTLTVPPNSSVAFPTGTQITVVQEGAGATTLAGGLGVTINSLNGELTFSGRYAAATLVKVDTDTWFAFGALGDPAAPSSEFADNVFKIQDDSDDTKALAYEVSAIATATTRTWTVPDRDIDFSANGTFAERDIDFQNQTGTTYTLVLTDAGKMVELNNASAITLTIPTNASVPFPIGTQIAIIQQGAGQVTVSSSATIRSKGGNLKLSDQYSGASLTKRGTDEWYLVGDLTA